MASAGHGSVLLTKRGDKNRNQKAFIWSHSILWRHYALTFLTASCWLWNGTYAFCPSGCQCDDATLTSHCPVAMLELVPIFFNPQVHHIDLHGNRIKEIHNSLGFYSNLRSLDLASNHIISLGRSNFESQDKLRVLNISDNILNHLDATCFHGLYQLEILDLSRNNLDKVSGKVFSHLKNLKELFLSWNRIRHLGDNVFVHSRFLHVLALDHNNFEKPPTNALTDDNSLHLLDLSANLLTYVGDNAFVMLRDLHTLVLSTNLIESVNTSAFHGLERMKVLDLSDNVLSEVPTDAISTLLSLKELDLSGNVMTTFNAHALNNLFRLEWLRVSRVPNLTSFHPRSLVDNTGLQVIEIEDNINLCDLPLGIFDGKPFIRVLALRRNGFRTLSKNAFPPIDSLEVLYVSGNPFECNCSLRWLWNWVSKINISVSFDEVICTNPPPLSGKLLSELIEPQLDCHLPVPTMGVVIAIAASIIFTLSCTLMFRWIWKYIQERRINTQVPTTISVNNEFEKKDLILWHAEEPIVKKDKVESNVYVNGMAQPYGMHHHQNFGMVRQVPSAFV